MASEAEGGGVDRGRRVFFSRFPKPICLLTDVLFGDGGTSILLATTACPVNAARLIRGELKEEREMFLALVPSFIRSAFLRETGRGHWTKSSSRSFFLLLSAADN